jgi:hypothetical protein
MFFFVRRPDRLWGPHNLIFNGYHALFPRAQSGQGVKLTTHLQASAEIKKTWINIFTPSYAFIVKHKDNFTFVYGD